MTKNFFRLVDEFLQAKFPDATTGIERRDAARVLGLFMVYEFVQRGVRYSSIEDAWNAANAQTGAARVAAKAGEAGKLPTSLRPHRPGVRRMAVVG